MILCGNDHSVDKFQEWNALHKNPSSRNRVGERYRRGLLAQTHYSDV